MPVSIPKTPKVATQIIGNLEEWQKQAAAKVSAKVARAVLAHAEKVLATALENVPERTGLLKSTLKIKSSGDGTRAVVKTDHGKAPHDFLVHFGTVKTKGVPFLFQAAERHQGELKPAIQESVDRGDG